MRKPECRCAKPGSFVKNPSVFLKKVEFVREYEIHDGVAIPETH